MFAPLLEFKYNKDVEQMPHVCGVRKGIKPQAYLNVLQIVGTCLATTFTLLTTKAVAGCRKYQHGENYV